MWFFNLPVYSDKIYKFIFQILTFDENPNAPKQKAFAQGQVLFWMFRISGFGFSIAGFDFTAKLEINIKILSYEEI